MGAEWKQLVTWDSMPDLSIDVTQIFRWSTSFYVSAANRDDIILCKAAHGMSQGIDETLYTHGTGDIDGISAISPEQYTDCAIWIPCWGKVLAMDYRITISGEHANDSGSDGYEWCFYKGDFAMNAIEGVYGDSSYHTGALGISPGLEREKDWTSVSHATGGGLITFGSSADWGFFFLDSYINQYQPIYLAIKEKIDGALSGANHKVTINLEWKYFVSEAD